MASNTAEAHECAICAHTASMVCRKCRSIHYCSVGCQKRDWPLHKQICKLFGKQTERPSPAHKRVIVFEQQGWSPRLEWIEDIPNGLRKQVERLMPPTKKSAHRFQDVDFNPRLRIRLHRNLQVWHHHSFLADGSTPNNTLHRLTGGTMSTQWRGTLVGTGLDEVDIETGYLEGLDLEAPGTLHDLTAADFRHLIDHLVMHGEEGCFYPMEKCLNGAGEPFEQAHMFKGVKVACVGEMGAIGEYSSVDIPHSHDMFELHHEVPAISRLVGMPVRVWMCPLGALAPSVAWLSNDAMTSLNMAVDPADPNSFGQAPHKWQSMVGSALVIREDGKRTTPTEIEDLCRWCNNFLRPTLSIARLGDAQMRADEIHQITEENFAAFCKGRREADLELQTMV